MLVATNKEPLASPTKAATSLHDVGTSKDKDDTNGSVKRHDETVNKPYGKMQIWLLTYWRSSSTFLGKGEVSDFVLSKIPCLV